MGPSAANATFRSQISEPLGRVQIIGIIYLKRHKYFGSLFPTLDSWSLVKKKKIFPHPWERKWGLSGGGKTRSASERFYELIPKATSGDCEKESFCLSTVSTSHILLLKEREQKRSPHELTFLSPPPHPAATPPSENVGQTTN